MEVDLNNLNNNDLYTLTTKYTYALGAVYKSVKLVGTMTDWRLTSKLKSDILSEYTRLSHLDTSLPEIEDLTFYIFKEKDDNVVILAKEYIEDIVIAYDEDYTR